jgi:hypothetical protein
VSIHDLQTQNRMACHMIQCSVQYSYPSLDDENDVKSKFLNFVSKWVGTELHKFEDKISIDVAKFMQSHIIN